MRSGSQARTSGGSPGCITATPSPVSTVAAQSRTKSGAAPRNAQPSAVASNPAITAVRAPSRAINSDPGTAAKTNRTGGRPVSTPTSVSDKLRSLWIRRISGGTARMVTRRPMPPIHKRATQAKRPLDGVSRRAPAMVASMNGSRQNDAAAPLALALSDPSDRLQPLPAHGAHRLRGSKRRDQQAGGRRARAPGKDAGREHRELLQLVGQRPDDVDAVNELELAHLLHRELDLALGGKLADHAVEHARLAHDVRGDAEPLDQLGEMQAAGAAARERDCAR